MGGRGKEKAGGSLRRIVLLWRWIERGGGGECAGFWCGGNGVVGLTRRE